MLVRHGFDRLLNSIDAGAGCGRRHAITTRAAINVTGIASALCSNPGFRREGYWVGPLEYSPRAGLSHVTTAYERGVAGEKKRN